MQCPKKKRLCSTCMRAYCARSLTKILRTYSLACCAMDLWSSRLSARVAALWCAWTACEMTNRSLNEGLRSSIASRTVEALILRPNLDFKSKRCSTAWSSAVPTTTALMKSSTAATWDTSAKTARYRPTPRYSYPCNRPHNKQMICSWNNLSFKMVSNTFSCQDCSNKMTRC